MGGAFQVVVMVKNPPASAGDIGDAVSIPGSERTLEEGMATYSGIPCLQNPRGQRILTGSMGIAKSWTQLSDFTLTFHFHALEKEMATYSHILAWKIPWMEDPGRLQSMGSLRVRHD